MYLQMKKKATFTEDNPPSRHGKPEQSISAVSKHLPQKEIKKVLDN